MEDRKKIVLDKKFADVMKTAKELDYTEVSKSEGDIQKLHYYDNLAQSIYLMREIEKRTHSKMPEIDTVENALKNIESFKNDFKKAFKLQNEIVMLIYNNVVVAEIASVSFLIASCLEYVQNAQTSTYDYFIKNIKSKDYNSSILYLKNLNTFNKMCVSGDMQRITNACFAKSKKYGNSFMGVDDATIVIGVVLTIVLIPFLQDIVYQVYASRIALADYLKMQSKFVEMNQAKLDYLDDKTKRKNVKNKQVFIATELGKIADKIDVDVKVSNKEASEKIIHEKSKPINYTTDVGESDSGSFGGMI